MNNYHCLLEAEKEIILAPRCWVMLWSSSTFMALTCGCQEPPRRWSHLMPIQKIIYDLGQRHNFQITPSLCSANYSLSWFLLLIKKKKKNSCLVIREFCFWRILWKMFIFVKIYLLRWDWVILCQWVLQIQKSFLKSLWNSRFRFFPTLYWDFRTSVAT